MGERGFIPPIRTVEGGWAVEFENDERELLVRLMDELRELLAGDTPNPLLDRLFPVAYPDDADKEAEYQRLMRGELVTSRIAAIDSVRETVAPGGPDVLDEAETIAFMQAINAVRLVLGSMLGIDDEDAADDAAERDDSAEHNLYAFLSWVLEWTVRALSPT